MSLAHVLPRPQAKPAPKTRLEMIVTDIVNAPGLYFCTSSSQEGVTYRVDAVNRTCTCPASGLCRHITHVWAVNAEDAIREQRARDYELHGIRRCACGRDYALVRDDPDEPALCVSCFFERRHVARCSIPGCANPALAGYGECSGHIFGEA